MLRSVSTQLRHLSSFTRSRIRSHRPPKREWKEEDPWFGGYGGTVLVVEVGLRDGLQNEPTIVSTQDKFTLIKMLAAAGCVRMEAGSFVSPKLVPQMADTKELMGMLGKLRMEYCTQISCLVPTMKYMKDAMVVPPDEIAIFASASEGFSQKNIHCSIEESLERFKPIIAEAKERDILVRGYLSCVIECPYDGKTDPKDVGRLTEQLLNMGCYEVSLGDTTGVGRNESTNAMLDAALAGAGRDGNLLAVHFHDTYGRALTNIELAIEKGVLKIDSSVAGLGGCPFAKGAKGNVATEDVVAHIDNLGFLTGIDLEKLVDAGQFICGVLGKKIESKTGKAILAKRNKTNKANKT